MKELEHWGVEVIVSDPWARPDEVHHEYGISLSPIDSSYPVDALVVTVGHQEYRAMDLTTLKRYCRHEKPVLADIKALYDRHEALRAGFTVFRF